MLCIPLGRKCAASAHFVFRKKERHRKTRQNQFMILPGFVTAETAGFEPACPKGANAFRVRLVMTTSIRLRKVWQPSAIFAERIRNLRCSSRASLSAAFAVRVFVAYATHSRASPYSDKLTEYCLHASMTQYPVSLSLHGSLPTRTLYHILGELQGEVVG